MAAPGAITAADIATMRQGLTQDTAKILFHRELLSEAINLVNAKMNTIADARNKLAPQHKMIFNAFRLCPIEKTKVVIVGQDPYIAPGQACGMSFSLPKGIRSAPSIRNIYEALKNSGEMATIPDHYDLTEWANRGVLLLNAALTTTIGVSGAHKTAWTKYIRNIITEIAKRPCNDNMIPPIFLLFGDDAQRLEPYMSGCTILKWRHPSPLANRGDTPAHFRYCTSFKDANNKLREHKIEPIDWNITSMRPVVVAAAAAADNAPFVVPAFTEQPRSAPPQPIADTLYIFTDGGATANGRANCRARWGVYVVAGDTEFIANDDVPLINIPGVGYQTSNQRAELMAIMYGLRYAEKSGYKTIVITTDSKYAINCIETWITSWHQDPKKLAGKMNLDLINPGRDAYDNIKKVAHLTIRHIRSHTKLPTTATAEDRFYWYGNYMADELVESKIIIQVV